jgi:hypothetical protein
MLDQAIRGENAGAVFFDASGKPMIISQAEEEW